MMQNLETKFSRPVVVLDDNARISGYASVFGVRDQGGDIVMPGAFSASLSRRMQQGQGIRMLWQHDQAEPIGVWDDVHEDSHGLRVSGRLLLDIARGREAASLLTAGAVDGLSIGYRAVRAEKLVGGGRKLHEVELWEVSLVTFPMLPDARVQGKAATLLEVQLAWALRAATQVLRG